jgi:hypothetical protein
VRRATISRILKSISQIRDSITQQTYIQKLSEVSKIGDLELIKELKKVAAAERPYKPRAEAPRREEPPMPDIPYQNDPDDPGYGIPAPAPAARRKDPAKVPAPSYEKELIRLMITHGYPIIEFVGSHVNADHFENDVMRILFDDLIERYSSHQPIALDVYLTDDRWKSLVSDMAMERHTPSARHEEKLGKKLTRDGDTLKTVKGELKALKMHYLDRLKVRFKENFDAATDPADRESCSRLLTEVAKERLRIEKTSADHLF